ncbi:MAG: sodium ion-translocating decarboxylase subunit beta, partial [Clostridia bacterium]|nr:sodium ion-translocating decarboxylase subunit beta [Clostridia bacterium]
MGFNYIFGDKSFNEAGQWMGWQYLVMYVIAGVLIYLAIGKKFEPLLLLPIAIGMFLTNLPGANLFHLDMWIDFEQTGMTVLDSIKMVINKGGFLDLLYTGVKLGIYPCIIFIGIGAMTDFTPLIANPKYFLIGAGAQLGVFVAFSAAIISGVYTIGQAASIGIIGGADGPTAILVTKT